MFTTKIYLNSFHLCFPNKLHSAVEKALQTRSFKIFATRTWQEITKRENSSSKKHNLSKIELFIPLKILNDFFTDTDIQIQFEKSLPTSEITKNPCSVQKKFHSKPLTNGQMTYKFKRQEHFDKNNLSHNRVHFSLKILQKTSDFHIFMEAR